MDLAAFGFLQRDMRFRRFLYACGIHDILVQWLALPPVWLVLHRRGGGREEKRR